MMSPLEKRHLQVSTGLFPSDKINILPFNRPFTQQVDVVFPEDPELHSVLSKLETRYSKGKTTLSSVLKKAGCFSGSNLGAIMVTPNVAGASSDLWCIDPRGVATLCLSKEAYEIIGITGRPLPFKGQSDQHVIQIPLNSADASEGGNAAAEKEAKTKRSGTKGYAKQKAAIEDWEKRRAARDGLDAWEVVCCSADPTQAPEYTGFNEAPKLTKVTCSQQKLLNVHIPIPSFKPRSVLSKSKKPTAGDEDTEDWDRDALELFEWAGLAILGSPRISANDRVDPYLAVYEPFQPSIVGNAAHLSWRGLLAPKFVQSVVENVLSCITNKGRAKFAFITGHAVSTSPVSGIKPGGKGEEGGKPEQVDKVSLRLPRPTTEDTWCLLVGFDSTGSALWTLLESTSQYDTRWG